MGFCIGRKPLEEERPRGKRASASRLRDPAGIEVRSGNDAEELFRLLVDSVQDYAIYMLDPAGRVTSWNPGARRIKQYDADEILGRHFSIFYPPEDVRAGKPERMLSLAREQGRVQDEGWRVRKDGTRFWADAVISAVRDPNGNLRGFAKVTRDMTERQQGEEARRALLVAQEANRRQEEFMAMVSHELRTPLTSILGWARMLRIGGLDPATMNEALDAMERSAQTQVHLIEDLLDETRITSGKLRLEMKPLELRSVVESALTDLAPSAEAKRIRLDPQLGCDRCSVIGDPMRLQQVIGNLVSNAIKFTPEGGTVTVRVWRNEADAEIEVRDNGRGIEAGLLPELFQRFRQGQGSSKRRSGLGLGLAISKYLVEQHGGRISAASDGPGKGAAFSVALPLASEDSDEFARRHPKRSGELPDLDGVRVLILEDESDNAQVLATVLRTCRAEVRWTANGDQALAIGDDWHPEVIVCDIALPGMDGCEFLQKAKRIWNAPALALTVYGTSDDEARVRACGFELFRQKPIEPADLAHDVARLARRGAASEPAGA